MMCTMLVAFATSLSLHAQSDGEQRDVSGARWVAPVEYLELNKIKKDEVGEIARSFSQRSAYDIQKIMKERGVKVLGMKLKPYIASGHDSDVESIFDFQEQYEEWGILVNDESFCIYTDEGINKSYDLNYSFKRNSREIIGWHYKLTFHDIIQLKDLRVAQTGKGVALSYAMDCAINASGTCEETKFNRGNLETDVKNVTRNNTYSKPVGVTDELAYFVYNKDMPLRLIVGGERKTEKEGERFEWRIWPRVCFVVEEILVEDEGGAFVLSNYMGDLLTWLTGRGDPLGLGEHSSALESAVINVIGIVSSILLSSGIASMSGGTGANIAAGLTEALLGSAAGSTPPPMSDSPDINGLEAKRKEEEEEGTPPDVPQEPEPVDPNKFNPSDYPYGGQYLSQQPDGDIVMKSPVTGKDVHFYSNGDGTWFTDSGCTYNADDIGERLRYEAENSGVLRQDAETAARNVAEQYAQWEAQNQRDLERGYSDEQKAYMDWKQEQANAEKKQELLEKLADKYHVAATEKAVKDAIKFEQTMNIIDAEVYADLGKQWDEGIETLKKVDKGCETIVNVMSGCVPGGGAVKNAYTFAKASLVATSEAIAEGKDLKEGAAHVWVGMVNGALGVIQNEAGNLTKGAKYAMVKELGINVVTEEAKEFINGIAKGQSLEEISKNMINATGKTTVSFGIGKLISGGIDKLKDTAKASLDPNDVDVDKFYFSEGTAKKIDKWLNKFEWSKTTNLKGTNIADANGVFGISKTANVVFGGQIEGDGLVGGLIGEVVNWSEDKKITNLTGWGGDVAEWANDKAVAGAANVMYGAGKVAETMPTDVIEAANSNDYSDIKDFVDSVTKFSNVAAAYRRYE